MSGKDDLRDMRRRAEAWRKLARQMTDQRTIQALEAEANKLEKEIEQATRKDAPGDTSTESSE